MSTHLRKRDENQGKDGKPYLYAYTPALAALPDMIPCDKDGNIVGAAADVVGGGLSRRPDPEKIAALAEIEKLKAEIAALKAAAPTSPASGKPDEKPDATGPASIAGNNANPLAGMDRMQKVDYAKGKFGEKAAHLKGNMKEIDIDNEIERLQAESDLPGADATK